MSAGGGHLQGTLHMVVAFDLVEIDEIAVVAFEKCPAVELEKQDALFAANKIPCMPQAAGGDHFDTNETESPYHLYKGLGKSNSYDIVFRAARFTDGKLTEKAEVTVYFNGEKVHKDATINQVWGGPSSGIDGGNDGGKGIADVPGGIKLQCEGHDVRYRNIWIMELDLKDRSTDF